MNAVGKRSIGLRVASGLGPFVVFGLVWQLATLFVPPSVLPSAWDIGAALGSLFTRQSSLLPWISQFGSTLLRIYSALLIASLVGIILGICIAKIEWIDDAVSPLLAALYPLPKPALIPLLAIWIGLGSNVIVVCAILSAMLPFVVNTSEGIRSISQKMIWSAVSLGAGKLDLLVKVILPAIVPNLFVALRIAHSMAVTTVVAAEIVVSQSGVGALISDFGNAGAYDYMFATVLIVILMAATLDLAVKIISNRLLSWHHQAERAK